MKRFDELVEAYLNEGDWQNVSDPQDLLKMKSKIAMIAFDMTATSAARNEAGLKAWINKYAAAKEFRVDTVQKMKKPGAFFMVKFVDYRLISINIIMQFVTDLVAAYPGSAMINAGRIGNEW